MAVTGGRPRDNSIVCPRPRAQLERIHLTRPQWVDSLANKTASASALLEFIKWWWWCKCWRSCSCHYSDRRVLKTENFSDCFQWLLLDLLTACGKEILVAIVHSSRVIMKTTNCTVLHQTRVSRLIASLGLSLYCEHEQCLLLATTYSKIEYIRVCLTLIEVKLLSMSFPATHVWWGGKGGRIVHQMDSS